MRVGIIGGGIAGLLTAWLLEDHYEVILCEQHNYLGGHARTAYVPIGTQLIPIETGFEFFNQKMFPYLWHLLHMLNIPLQEFPFNYTFFNQHDASTFILPPIRKNKVFWKNFLPLSFFNLLQLRYVINAARPIVDKEHQTLTLDQFMNSLWITSSFKEKIFFPLFCSGWGVDKDEFKTFNVYNILAWIINNKSIGFQESQWHEVANGVSSYINKLQQDLKFAHIYTDTSIEKVIYAQNKYILMSKNTDFEVDYLVIATNAIQARHLLQNIPHAYKICNVLSKVDYINAQIAVHHDDSFMPRKISDWSTVNVCYKGNYSALTIYKSWKSQEPIFRSWIVPGFSLPKSTYAVEHYYHAKPNTNYFNVQQQLASLQGQHNLYIAGIYTNGIDSHESALISALKVAHQLAPTSERLQKMEYK